MFPRSLQLPGGSLVAAVISEEDKISMFSANNLVMHLKSKGCDLEYSFCSAVHLDELELTVP